MDEAERRAIAAGMTQEEFSLLVAAGDLFNRFVHLPQIGQDQGRKVSEAVHVIQDLLLMRPTWRKLNSQENDG